MENNNLKEEMVCPECNTLLGKETDICPKCGYVFNKKKKKRPAALIITGIIIIVLLIIIIILKVVIDYNTFKITQIYENIELGDEIKDIDLVQYDSSNILKVDVKDNGGFDTNKIGTYTIIYNVTNNKKNFKEISYIYTVKDSVNPTIMINSPEVYEFTGNDFFVENYVSVEDNSEIYEVKYDGEVNINKAGTYNIQVYAEDESGNVSSKQDLVVIYEEPRVCDVRNVCFGDSKEEVMRYEGYKESDSNITQEENYICKDTFFDGYGVYLIYYFNKKDELYSVVYSFKDWYTDGEKYLDTFYYIYDKVEEKYGEPDDEEIVKGDLFNYCSSLSQAINTGQVQCGYQWEEDNMFIKDVLEYSNSTVQVTLYYTCLEYVDDENDF